MPEWYRVCFGHPTTVLTAHRLVQLEETFAKEIRRCIRIGRFMRPNIAALLQHYGYRTSWLDVIDNLWTAVWFATHEITGVNGNVEARCRNSSGWLYFLSVPDECHAIDLRESQHGLSLRPHAQAGWSVRGHSSTVRNLDSLVLATVEFPVTDRWKLLGYIGSEAFFFPSSELDDTLKRIWKHDVDSIARRVEDNCGVRNETLGCVFPAIGTSAQ